jgi:uncharacterized protein
VFSTRLDDVYSHVYIKFEWDENKRLSTLAERGLDFRDARHLFDGRPFYSYPSPREGEDRTVSIGSLAGRMIAVVWRTVTDYVGSFQ